MSEPMKLKYTPEQFQKLLNRFQSAVDSGEYTEKIPYETWRKLKKLYHPKIEYISPFVKIYEVIPNIDGVDRDVILFSAKTYDWGFGRFFYDYVVKEKTQEMTSIDASKLAVSFTAASDSTSCYSNSTAVNGKSYSNRIDTLTDTYSYLDNKIECCPTFAEVEKMINEKITEKKKGNENMKGFNFDFGPCTPDQARMSMYGIAVKNTSGVYVAYNPKAKEIIDVDILNFDGSRFMYKMPVAIKDVAIGDVIIHNRKPMFVVEINEEGKTFTCVDPMAGEQKQIIPTTNLFGFNFITKIVSLFNTFGENAPSPDQPFGNMLPLMLMGDNGKIDPMMLMMMMGGKMDMSNPMMLYFMMKDNKDIDPIVLMAMSGIFNAK